MRSENSFVALTRRGLLAALGGALGLCVLGLGRVEAVARALTSRLIVTAKNPLRLDRPVSLGHVILQGGQIIITGGGRFRFAELTKGCPGATPRS